MDLQTHPFHNFLGNFIVLTGNDGPHETGKSRILAYVPSAFVGAKHLKETSCWKQWGRVLVSYQAVWD